MADAGNSAAYDYILIFRDNQDNVTSAPIRCILAHIYQSGELSGDDARVRQDFRRYSVVSDPMFVTF